MHDNVLNDNYDNKYVNYKEKNHCLEKDGEQVSTVDRRDNVRFPSLRQCVTTTSVCTPAPSGFAAYTAVFTVSVPLPQKIPTSLYMFVSQLRVPSGSGSF